MTGGRASASLATSFLLALVLAWGLSSVSEGRSTRPRPPCASPNVESPRDPANPLAIPAVGGYVDPLLRHDPLRGAHFFVDGPKHGQGAGAVARALGLNPEASPVNQSWAGFASRHARAIARNRTASELSKIAGQEETQNVSQYSEGGGPGAIYGQTHKILCTNLRSDHTPATVAVFSTYFIYPSGLACPSLDVLERWQGRFHRYVNEMARAINRRRAVVLEEIDSTVLSSCLGGAALRLWEGDLRYESQQFSRLPHTVVYAEAGYSDARGPRWTARRLWQEGVYQVRGFFTNDTHFVWSSDEISWATKVVRFLSGISHGRYHAHFVVNTAQNGQGPKRNPHPFHQGNENLCNPPGRGLGRIPTGDVVPATTDGLRLPNLDGFLWTGVPGRSHNSNCPGGPWKPPGVFDPRFALELAENADQRLGPGYPSHPY
jgi:endoglucanase